MVRTLGQKLKTRGSPKVELLLFLLVVLDVNDVLRRYPPAFRRPARVIATITITTKTWRRRDDHRLESAVFSRTKSPSSVGGPLLGRRGRGGGEEGGENYGCALWVAFAANAKSAISAKPRANFIGRGAMFELSKTAT